MRSLRYLKGVGASSWYKELRVTVSARHRTQARDAILRWHQKLRQLRSLCGAKRKHDGETCRQIAMANGRCYYHGGRTGSGKDWHKTKWPKGTAPDVEEKLARKLRNQAHAANARKKRLAAMNEEQRARYDQWQRTHQPGSPASRAAKRAERKQASWLRERLAKDEPPNPARNLKSDDVDIFG